MKKKNILNIALAALPLIAVVLAAMPNAVTVYQTTGPDIAMSCSFFTLIEDVSTGVCLLFAGICGAAAFGMAVLYLVKQSAFWLTGIAVAAFASMTLAVLPVVIQSDTYLIPNMWVPILMLAETLIAYGALKSAAPEEKKGKAKLLKN